MVAECATDRSSRALLELLMSAVSLGLLGYFTGYFFIEASRSVGLLPAHGGEEEVVDPYIVVFFAGLGILFDVLSLCSYKALTSPPHFTPSLHPNPPPPRSKVTLPVPRSSDLVN